MNKREEILKSSLMLFSSLGYENVGIQKIVESVHVTKPTLYHYFGSKQGLLSSVLDFYYSPFLEKLKVLSEYNGDIVKSLETITKYCFEFAKLNPEIYNFVLTLNHYSEESEASKTAKIYTDGQFNIIEELFKKAEKSHGNMKGRSANFTISYLGMVSSYITGYLIGRCNLDDRGVYEACRQYMYGIFS